jgi:hypothetical protein
MSSHNNGNFERPSFFGSDNPAWRGDKITYSGLHQYVRKWLSKPDLCVNCKRVPPKDIYCTNDVQTRNLEDWVWLCRTCIMYIDGRNEKSHSQSAATREKISKSKMGIPRTKELKDKLRQWHLGTKRKYLDDTHYTYVSSRR